jgi:membrane associated rhomboid family serine protease
MMAEGKLISSYTGWIIAANVVVYIVLTFVGFDPFVDCGLTVCKYIAFQPAAILAGSSLWTFLTSMFMHAGLFHLFANMVSLMFIGNFLEKLIGKKRFIWLYFAGGIFAGVLSFALANLFGNGGIGGAVFGDPLMYAVGASGAIMALGGLLAVLTPRLPVLVFFVLPMPMWAAMGVLMFGLWGLSVATGFPIGNIAHLGGLLVGVGYGFYLKKKFPRKTKMISQYFAR